LLVPELPGLGELERREPTKCAVCSLVIHFVSPGLEEHLRFEKTVELLIAEEFVTWTNGLLTKHRDALALQASQHLEHDKPYS
jgi:hypothetical protein